MKIKEIRDLTTEELQLKVTELKKELFSLRFSLATNNLENPMKISTIKKDIAKVLTVIREKELKGEE
ncbi:MAG: 50S ribosomal protein L29 [Oscillospiraceae bacterium]|nr:50S ribosomal protein L29 [Clostridia bacterium]MBQ8782052.1 50S ribosomal protein L29 [Oscillospiraceae bacterium]